MQRLAHAVSSPHCQHATLSLFKCLRSWADIMSSAISEMGELPARCCQNTVALYCTGVPREDKYCVTYPLAALDWVVDDAVLVLLYCMRP